MVNRRYSIAIIAFALILDILLSYAFAHGALADEGGEGLGPIIFIPVIIAFGLFIIFATKTKGWSVLVIGGAGYVGSTLVKKLLNGGHRVTVLDTFVAGAGGLDSVKMNLDLIQIEGDFRDPNKLEEALIGCDAIIYLVRERPEENKRGYQRVGEKLDSEHIRALIRRADKAGIKRILFTSSMSVFGNVRELVISEETIPEPVSEISNYLLNCEKVVRSESYPGMHTCIVRPASIIGSSLTYHVNGELNKIILEIISKGHIKSMKGFKSYPYMHIGDLTDFYIFLLNQPGTRIHGQIYNAGSGQLSDSDLFEILNRVFGGALVLEFDFIDHLMKRDFSFRKITDDLGFVPRWDIVDGVKDLVSFYRAGSN